MTDEIWQLSLSLFAIGLAIDIIRRVVLSSFRVRELSSGVRQVAKDRPRPWVTVLVYSQNRSSELEDTVRQVCTSRYPAFDVVAISDRSEDDTVTRINHFIARHKRSRQVRLFRRRATSSLTAVYRAAYRVSRRGDVVLMLKAGDQADPYLLKRAVVARGSRSLWQVATSRGTGYLSLADTAPRFGAILVSRPNYVTACLPRLISRYAPVEIRSLRPGWLEVVTMLIWLMAIWGIITFGISDWMVLWKVWLITTTYLLLLILTSPDIQSRTRRRLIMSTPAALFLIPVTEIIMSTTRLIKGK